MDRRLDTFIEAHPDGWNHDDWLGLLSELEQDGIDTCDSGTIGSTLESRRLAWELRRRAVPGLGPKRIEAITGCFGSLWELRQADPERVADLKAIPGAVAAKVVEAVR